MLEASAHPGRTRPQPPADRGRRGAHAALARRRAARARRSRRRGEPAGSASSRSACASASASPRPWSAIPEILVLDEPANGLDPEGIRWLRGFLRGLAAEGRTILLSSHVLAEVAQTVDEVVVISKGELVAHAPLEELTANGNTGRVRLRSPELARLTRSWPTGGMQTHPNGDDVLTVSGASQEAIGQLAFDNRIVLYEIAGEGSSLEEVFLRPDDARRGGRAMTALIRSELLAVRTLRTTYIVPIALLALVGLIVGASMAEAGKPGNDHAGRAARAAGGHRRDHERGLRRGLRRDPGRRRVPLRDDQPALPGRITVAGADREARHLRGPGRGRSPCSRSASDWRSPRPWSHRRT